MILVDTSVWIDHLHKTEPLLVEALENAQVIQHPMVVGELSLEHLKRRQEILDLLTDLPSAQVATHEEVLHLTNEMHLYGRGLSLVDVHLLAAVRLTPGTGLWTRDKRLSDAAEALQIGWPRPGG